MVALLLVAMLVAASLWMALAWLVSTRTGRSGFTDVFWTYGTGIAGVVVALVPLDPGASTRPRQILVAVLVAAWALRLGTHILRRTLKGGDDPRYAKMKETWGDAADRQMFWFLQIQAGTIAVLVLAVFVAARAPRPDLDGRDALGALVAVAGIVGEMASDRQLRRFAADPANRGGVCDIGLWRYSRHPNYFFEVVGWWAYPVIAIGGRRLWLGMAGAGRTPDDLLAAGARLRHPAARGLYAPLARRGLPRLSGPDERLHSLATRQRLVSSA